MKRFLSVLLAVMMLLSCMASVTVGAAAISIEALSAYGDMEGSGLTGVFTTRLSSTTFGEVTELSFEKGAGVDGSRGAVVTKTGDITGYTGSLKSDRFTLKSDKISFKSGYTYYFSTMLNASMDGIGIYTSIERDGGGDFTWSTRYGTGAKPATTNEAFSRNSANAVSTTKDEWKRLTWSFAVDSITSKDKEPMTETGNVFNTYMLLSYGNVNGEVKGEYPIYMYIDDKYILEVPSDDLTASVKPVVYGVELTPYGASALRAGASFYDVNPGVTPVITYKWQEKNDDAWTDISGATEMEYSFTDADKGKTIRCEVTATSTNSDGDELSAVAYSDEYWIEGDIKFEPDTDSMFYKMSQLGDMEGTGITDLYTSRAVVNWPSIASFEIKDGEGVDGSKAAVFTRTAAISASSIKTDRFSLKGSNRVNLKNGYTYYWSAMMKSTHAKTYAGFVLYGTPHTTITGSDAQGNAATERTLTSLHPAFVYGTATDYDSTKWNRITGAHKVTAIDGGVSETGSSYEAYIAFGASGNNGLNGTTDYSAFPQTTVFDDFYVLEVPTGDLQADAIPVVYGAAISGEFKRGQTLTAAATAYDVNPNITPSLTLTWQRLEGGEWKDIATGSSYAIKDADLGYKLRVKAEAKSVTKYDVTKTDVSYSDEIETTEVTGFAPKADNLKIEGKIATDETIEGKYDYSDADGEEESGTTFEWLRADSENGAYVSTGIKTQSYKLSSADEGKFLKFTVTPKNGGYPDEGVTAELVFAGPAAPEAKNVSITGDAKIGSLLKGTFEYFDVNGSEAGEHLYYWYKADTPDGEKTALSSETDTLYVSAELDGKYIFFGVAPVSSDKPAGGETVVYSNPVIIGEKVENTMFVAVDGDDDEGDGTIENPYATLAKAKDAVRKMKVRPEGGITVYFRGGEYVIEDTVSFTASDSGSDECPIVYRAYKDEKVVFTSARNIDFSKFVPVSGEMRDKLIDETAKSKVVVADFDDIGLSDYQGMGITTKLLSHGAVNAPLMEFDGEMMLLSRYPNSLMRSQWHKVECTSEDETSYTFSYAGIDRVDKWQHNGGEGIMSVGFFSADWYAEANFFDIDHTAKTMTSNTGSYLYGISSPGAKRDAFFLNIYEELDMPGEWYADEINKKLYIYPNTDNKNPVIKMTNGNHTFLKLSNVNNVTFSGIEMMGGKSICVSAANCDKLVFDNCDMHMFEGGVGSITASTNSGIRNSEIYHFQKGALTMTGGDVETLTPSGSFVTNNYFHDFSIYCESYGAAIGINIGSVGIKIDHNEFANCPHEVISYRSYYNVVEYNVFHNVCTNAADMGAIYTGRKLNQMGNIFRYNHFYDIGDPDGDAQFKAHAFFSDDGASGDEIYGNVFGPNNETSEVLKVHGGMNNKIYNNLYIDSGYRLFADAAWRKIQWQNILINNTSDKADGYTDPSYRAKNFGDLYLTMMEVVDNEVIMGQFPWLRELYEEPDMLSNVFTRNAAVFVDIKMPSGWGTKANRSWYDRRFPEDGEATGLDYNVFVGNDRGEEQFVDFANGDYTLNPNSEIFEKMPDFEPIPFREIGRFKVNGAAPAAENVNIVGNLEYSKTLSGFYKYTDAEADMESGTTYRWLMSDTADGEYTVIEGAVSNVLEATEALSGKYVKFEVTVADETGRLGQPVLSDSFFVLIDDGSLDVLIEATEAILDDAVAGTGLGEYSKAAIDALKETVEAAKTAEDKEAAVKDIEEKTEALMNSRVLEATAAGSVTIPENMPSATVNMGDISDGAVIEFADADCGKLTINGTVNGKSVKIVIPAGYKVAGNKLEIKPSDVTDAAVYGDFYLVMSIGGEEDVLNADVTVEGAEALSVVYTPELEYLKILGNDCTFTAKQGGEYAILKSGEASSDAMLASISVNGEALKGSMNKDTFTYLTDAGDVPVVTAVASGARAKVEITQATAIPGVATIKVTAEDGTTKTYTVRFVLKGSDSDDSDDKPSDGMVSGGPSSSGGAAGGSSGGGSNVSYVFDGVTNDTIDDMFEEFCFDDVVNHWAKNDIMDMYKKGIVSGVTEKTFEPDRSITRAEFATLVAKALKLEEAKSDFADVAETDWFAPFVGAAAKAGIIVGADGKFRPNDTITRQEMAVIIVKAYEYLGKSAEVSELTFSDSDEIADWAKEYVAKAVGAGLISGMGDNKFAPADNATRAQSASIISRILK